MAFVAFSLEQQAEASSKVEQRDSKANQKREHFYERKLQEYEAEVANMEVWPSTSFVIKCGQTLF